MRQVPEIGQIRHRGNGKAPAKAMKQSRFQEEFPLLTVLREDGSADAAEVLFSDSDLVRLHRLMLLGRLVDEKMINLQRQGRLSFYVTALGEEATVAGSISAVEDHDWVFPCYREHAAALHRGLPISTFICDLIGNSGDVNKGHQMPCHESWRPGRFTSISSPIATQITQAVGAAWAAKIRHEDMVSLVYFGEGATSANDFHAGLNFASVQKAPTVFLCRNNGWAISLPSDKQTGSETYAQKAIAYGICGERVDGNDVLAVANATRRARARAAAGDGPTLIECVTYRMEGHTTSDDPKAYRPDHLVEPWRAKDPIRRFRRFLDRRGLLDDQAEEKMKAEIHDEIGRAIEEAESYGRKPPIETLFEGVYAEMLWPQREQLEELKAAIAADPRVANPDRS